MSIASPRIQNILDSLPTRPGVYLMKNDRGEVIYVGKAVNLRSRVRSYFQPSTLAQKHSKTARMVEQVADIDIIVVDSELEALLTEINLIKAHKPHYNIRLKDDKRYPYIKVHWADPYPKVTVTRRMVNDGSRYFGPYTNVSAVYQTLDVLRKAFPYLTCDRNIDGNDERACLYYDIKLCNAPCIGAVSQEEYRATIQSLMDFLQGKSDEIVERLQARMWQAAEQMDYEKAARLRDQIQAMQQVTQRQKVVSSANTDQDVIAFARENGDAAVQIFFIRNGRIVGKEHYVLEGTGADEDEAGVMADFLKQFYDKAAEVPPEVLLPHEIEEAEIIEHWLRSKRGNKVVLKVPRRGMKRQLVQLAAENAVETLALLRAQWEADTLKQETALQEIQNALGLERPPARIECFDISNTQGTAISASRVVFVNGVPRKSEYRKFNIRTVQGHADDYASMKEALDRRFRRWQDAQNEPDLPGKKPDPTWSILPDLLIVDGGKGQLGVAVEVLESYGLTGRVPVVGLAKQHEELFVPGRSRSIMLPRRSQGLYLLQRIRDEAHRFAITHQRQRRVRMGVASQLDSIPGIGPTRRRALLKHFGSLDAIREASVEQIAAVPGISRELAETIKAEL
ncbi:MAG TPA: excinuclease ABC subunit UvrC [Aggregatilineales bacterium]|nr:excinuclease ABC subunit UvrC [Aggregatilineales bacterium]HPV06433.1 excinuclease ABC subunit UvrC [Aggregatilineales bacterium]HQA68843.1 excinuclease ABC subunit UvrC [Aggregatilineales bacterium]HQE19153.1 excinuclease ABC subunit UvrC [Aggregatilineales bacterium]